MQDQQHNLEELKAETEQLRLQVAQLEKNEAHLRVTLNSIGDAVISTDLEGNIVQMNPLAQKLTGWSLNDALGKPFAQVFQIINAQTRQHIENPVAKVLECGKPVGLTNHTILQSADGREYQIADSAAPIRDENNRVWGVVMVFRDVTEEYANRKEIRLKEEALNTFLENSLLAQKLALDTDERFRTLAENLPGVVYLCRNDEKYSMLYLNNTVETVTGYAVEDFLGNHISFVELYHPEYKEEIFKQVDEAIARHEPFHLVYRLQHKDKSWRWIEEWGIGVWHDNDLKYLEGFLADITEKKEDEKNLFESQERFQRLINNSPDILYSFSTLRGGSYHSPSVAGILGYTPDQLKEEPMLWENAIHPDDREMVRNAVADTALGHTINVEYRIKSASGEWLWLHDRSMHLHDNYGEILIEGLAKDITLQKNTEEKLKQSEQNYKRLQELFRNLADIMPDMLWAKDMNKNYIFVNNSVCKNLLNAKDTNEPIGKGDLFFAQRERNAHPEYSEWHTFGELCRDSDEVVMQSGETQRFDEFGNVRGKFLFLDVIKTPLHNEKGEMIGVVGTARDVTEKRKAELKLIESEANLKAIIENSLENIWSINTKYEIQYINAVFASAFEQAFGLRLTQGSNVIEALPESIKSIWKKRYDKALGGEQFFFQEKISAGEFPIYIHVAMNPIRVEETVVGVSVFARDITEQILAEKKLIEAKEKAEQSDRLKTAFINNITHEIRTPLNGILGFGQMMAETDLTIKERMEYLKILQESSNRLLQTVTDFMDISMLNSGNMEVIKTHIQLNVFMDELYQRTKSLCTNKDVVVNLDLPDNSSNFVITSDRELLRKALNHLLGNSEKFTHQGSIIAGYRVKDNKLTFFVKDTGVGIPKDKMKSMFDVFMQGDTSITRGYEGSGLGLSIAKRIITLLGGEIWAESETGTGTTVYISLTDPVTEVKQHSPQPITFRETNADKPLILIAEDDESNSFFIKVVLEKSGYATIRVNNGVDAVKSCRNNKEICLVLMDIKMPEMNGIEATKAIREFLPDLPVVALTAYAHSNDEHRIMEAGCTSFLSKPVKKEDLLKMLSVLLPGNLQ